MRRIFLFGLLSLLSSIATSEWTATDSLREYMRNAPGTIHGDVPNLRGNFDVNKLFDEALMSARLSKVQSAVEAGLRAQQDFSSQIDEAKFNQVKKWHNELDRRMGLIEYCKTIRGQGWDGECLLIDNWWKSVKCESINNMMLTCIQSMFLISVFIHYCRH